MLIPILLYAADDLQRGQTFVLLDCGGGTTDIGTYSIAHSTPVRLSQEVKGAEGEYMLCIQEHANNAFAGLLVGANDINEAFRAQVLEHLQDALSRGVILSLDDRIRRYVDTDLMYQFENGHKKTFATNQLATDFTFTFWPLEIHGYHHNVRDGVYRMS